MKLILKTLDKIKESKLGKIALGATLIATMAANTATFVACKPEVEPEEQTKNEQVVDPTNPAEQDPTEQDPTEPIVDPNGNPTEQKEEIDKTTSEYLLSQIDLNQYSDILKKVLSDEYYMDVRDRYGVDIHSHDNILQAIPYGNLKSLGYSNTDINHLLKDEYYANSFVYLQDDYLYVAFNAETKPDSEKYMGSFLLKYELTDQELYEIKMLHRTLAKGNDTYLEASLFIQALSQLKTPEVISSAYITKDAIDLTMQNINNKNTNYYNSINSPVFINLKSVEKLDDYYIKSVINIFSDTSNSAISENAQMVEVTRNVSTSFRYTDGKLVVFNCMEFENKLRSMKNSGALDSSIVNVTRLASDKTLTRIVKNYENDINYLKSINYQNELTK